MSAQPYDAADSGRNGEVRESAGRSGLLSGTGGVVRAQNIALTNVRTAFQSIPADPAEGTYIASKADDKYFPSAHLQGMSLYSNSNGNFLLLAHDDTFALTGAIIAVDANTGVTQSWRTSLSGFNHPGGMQTVGDFLVVPVAKSNDSDSYIEFYALSTVGAPGGGPVVIEDIRIARGKNSSAAGMVYANGVYYLAIYAGMALDVYVSNAVSSLLDPSLVWGQALTVSTPQGWDNINLLADVDGNVFLCGLRGEEGFWTQIIDYADLCSLTVTDGSVALTLLSTIHLIAVDGTMPWLLGPHCRFGAGSQVLSPTTFNLYCCARNFAFDDNDLEWNAFYGVPNGWTWGWCPPLPLQTSSVRRERCLTRRTGRSSPSVRTGISGAPNFRGVGTISAAPPRPRFSRPRERSSPAGTPT